DALNGAVASAVESAVRQAVSQAVRETLQAVIAEALTNADLVAAARTLLAPGTPADVPADPPERPRGLFRRAGDAGNTRLGVAAAACNGAGAYVANKAAAVTSAARSGWRLLRRFRGRLLIACGVGVAAGAATLLAAPWLGVATASMLGFCGTLAVKARNALRGLFAPAPAFA